MTRPPSDDPKAEVGSFDREPASSPATRSRPDTAPPVLHAGVGGWTKCRSCQQDIVFAKTTTGKLAPYEADPNGLWTIENGAARYLGKQAEQLELGEKPAPRFTSHFVSCRDRDQWRKRNA